MRFAESTVMLHVRPNDLDIVGHVNHATALEYLEAGRWTWMEQHGLRRPERVMAVVSRIEVDYRREILPQQQVVVRTRLVSPEAEELEDAEAIHYRACFQQQLLLEGGQVAVEARVEVGFLETAGRTLCAFQDFLAAARE